MQARGAPGDHGKPCNAADPSPCQPFGTGRFPSCGLSPSLWVTTQLRRSPCLREICRVAAREILRQTPSMIETDQYGYSLQEIGSF